MDLYYATVDGKATQFCFLDRHAITLLPNLTKLPFVNFLPSLSSTQSASLFAVSTGCFVCIVLHCYNLHCFYNCRFFRNFYFCYDNFSGNYFYFPFQVKTVCQLMPVTSAENAEFYCFVILLIPLYAASQECELTSLLSEWYVYSLINLFFKNSRFKYCSFLASSAVINSVYDWGKEHSIIATTWDSLIASVIEESISLLIRM